MTKPVADMTKIERVIEGLQIFQSLGARWTWAEHDEIGVDFDASDDPQPSDEQKKRLEELRWFIDSEVDAWATFT